MDDGEVVVAIAGMLTGLLTLAAIMWGLVQYARLRRQSEAAPARVGEVEERVELLAQELEQVKAQLAETHERLDFTERLLAQSHPPAQLPRA